jgi:sugar phosphate isomerase/epimerase
MAEPYGVTLCAKAHVGGAIYNTPTTLRAMREITAPAFGVDMDPSHIYRGGDQPEDAIKHVISRMKHIHIRDCTGRQPSPGHPFKQMCGSGEIDLFGYFKAAVEAKYDGPVCLEVIGPDLRIEEATLVAAESYGYMNACLKILGAR